MFSVSFCPLWGLFLLCSAESTLCSCIFRQTAACQILLSVLFPNTSCKTPHVEEFFFYTPINETVALSPLFPPS